MVLLLATRLRAHVCMCVQICVCMFAYIHTYVYMCVSCVCVCVCVLSNYHPPFLLWMPVLCCVCNPAVGTASDISERSASCSLFLWLQGAKGRASCLRFLVASRFPQQSVVACGAAMAGRVRCNCSPAVPSTRKRETFRHWAPFLVAVRTGMVPQLLLPWWERRTPVGLLGQSSVTPWGGIFLVPPPPPSTVICHHLSLSFLHCLVYVYVSVLLCVFPMDVGCAPVPHRVMFAQTVRWQRSILDNSKAGQAHVSRQYVVLSVAPLVCRH